MPARRQRLCELQLACPGAVLLRPLSEGFCELGASFMFTVTAACPQVGCYLQRTSAE